MKRLSTLLLVPLAAACTSPGNQNGSVLGIFRQPQPEVATPAPLPPQVLAALPPGVPASVVTRQPDGCYLITLERTDPPSGYPLRDAIGNRICDGSPIVSAVPFPGQTLPVPPAIASTPLDPAATAAGGGPPVPTAVLGAPPPPSLPTPTPAPLGTGTAPGMAAPAPLAPGNITPPAPIVQPSPT
jgi:hypothetical protein